MIKKCKHCNLDIEVKKPQAFGAHVRNCNNNPDLIFINKKISDNRKGSSENKKKCPKCEKEFRGCTFDRHLIVCGNNIKNKHDFFKFINKKSENEFICLICNEEFNKFGIFSHIYMKHINDKKRHYSEQSRLKMAWHKGLTKENDERLKKKSDKQKQYFALGLKTANFKGKKHSEKTREILSIKQSKRIEELGENSTLKHFKNVKFYKIKNILEEEYSVRGSYELKLAEWFNKNHIIWKRKIYLKYVKDEVKKTYAPDFFIPKYNIYFETKGYYSKSDKEKMKLVNQQNNIDVKMLFRKEVNDLENVKSFEDLLKISKKC